MSLEYVAEVWVVEPGNVVRVRVEPSPSLVLPMPENASNAAEQWGEPVVWVRTPADDEQGKERLVQVGDLTLWDPG